MALDPSGRAQTNRLPLAKKPGAGKKHLVKDLKQVLRLGLSKGNASISSAFAQVVSPLGGKLISHLYLENEFSFHLTFHIKQKIRALMAR